MSKISIYKKDRPITAEKVLLTVLENNGEEAILRDPEAPDNEVVVFHRETETLEEFFQEFPVDSVLEGGRVETEKPPTPQQLERLKEDYAASKNIPVDGRISPQEMAKLERDRRYEELPSSEREQVKKWNSLLLLHPLNQ